MSLATRAFFVSALLVPLVLPAQARAAAPSNRIVILSTTDMKGKTSPCGCSVPKGGFSRQASFIDSLRGLNGQVLLLDTGGFFPEHEEREDLGVFMMSIMKVLGVNAVGVGERDLRFGINHLKQQSQKTGLPLICANLVDKRSQKPVFAPSTIKTVSGVKVGIFALIGDLAQLGPGGEALAVLEPATVARKTIASLRASGANVVVLLSQLGKVESEDLVAVVEGIDALIPGNRVPVLQKGRMIKNTVACYGGEQGQYMCKTVLNLDGKGRVTTGEADAVMMGPEVKDKPAILKTVRDFEDAANERLRKQQKSTRIGTPRLESPGGLGGRRFITIPNPLFPDA